jgi:3-phosphoshikimate 1-carboxyvinyltransferase
MQITIHKSEIQGDVRAPSSKSYTIRALMCAALAEGESHLSNPLWAGDTQAAVRVLRQIGVKIDLDKNRWKVRGGQFRQPAEDLFCGDSAATLRFMTALCSLVPGKSCLTTGASLAKRPIKTLVDALRKWGIDISCQNFAPPLSVSGSGFKGGLTELPGDISSQFVSALLMLAPRADTAATIWLTTPLESRAYVEMTLQCLNKFGIQVRYSDELMEYEIAPQNYQAAHYNVEGDWSSSSYLLALGAVAGKLKTLNLNPLSLQGDKTIVTFLRTMEASVEVAMDSVTVSKNRLRAIKVDLNECIDLLPTMAVLAALAEGRSEFTGIQRARLKESNRVQALAEELTKCGIQVIEEPDKLIIQGGRPQPAVIDSHNDHRIAMAMSLLGVAAGGITICNAECVNKTYPEYWDRLRQLGVKIDEQ